MHCNKPAYCLLLLSLDITFSLLLRAEVNNVVDCKVLQYNANRALHSLYVVAAPQNTSLLTVLQHTSAHVKLFLCTLLRTHSKDPDSKCFCGGK